MHHRIFISLAAAGILTGVGASAQAADFYAGKTVSVYIGYGPGSSYDKYARLLTDHMGRFLPGSPKMLARNMPCAGWMRVTNYIYTAAPKDGTAWGAPSRAIATEPLLYGARSKAAFKDPI